jgi:peptidoglycan hydrolase CwlO-like protein
MVESLKKVYDEKISSVGSSLREFEERVKRLVVQLEDEKSRRTQVQEYNKELRELIDKLRSQVVRHIIVLIFQLLTVSVSDVLFFVMLLCL